MVHGWCLAVAQLGIVLRLGPSLLSSIKRQTRSQHYASSTGHQTPMLLLRVFKIVDFPGVDLTSSLYLQGHYGKGSERCGVLAKMTFTLSGTLYERRPNAECYQENIREIDENSFLPEHIGRVVC